MDLNPLPYRRRVAPADFAELFAARLGPERYAQVLACLVRLDSVHDYTLHAFSIANLVNLGLQKGNVDEVIRQLLRWLEIADQLPSPCPIELLAKFHADTRYFIDLMYGELFMSDGDTLDGVAMPKPIAPEELRGNTERAHGRSRLIVPGQPPPGRPGALYVPTSR